MIKFYIPTLIALFLSITSSIDAATIFARIDGEWDVSGTWSTAGVGGADCACFPAAGDSVVIDGYKIIVKNANETVSSVLLTNNRDAEAFLSIENGKKLTITGNLWVNSENVGELLLRDQSFMSFSFHGCCSLSFDFVGQRHVLVSVRLEDRSNLGVLEPDERGSAAPSAPLMPGEVELLCPSPKVGTILIPLKKAR